MISTGTRDVLGIWEGFGVLTIGGTAPGGEQPELFGTDEVSFWYGSAPRALVGDSESNAGDIYQR